MPSVSLQATEHMLRRSEVLFAGYALWLIGLGYLGTQLPPRHGLTLPGLALMLLPPVIALWRDHRARLARGELPWWYGEPLLPSLLLARAMVFFGLANTTEAEHNPKKIFGIRGPQGQVIAYGSGLICLMIAIRSDGAGHLAGLGFLILLILAAHFTGRRTKTPLA